MPSPTLPFTDDVLPWLAARRAEGSKTALVTLVGIDGASPRPLGAQMAVDDTGAFVGMISGGCVEAAIAKEAVAALEAGANRVARYGAGSPYLDIRLPCGSGIDVLIDVGLSDETVAALIERRRARRPATLVADLKTGASCATDADAPTRRDGDLFHRRYLPTPRLVVFGDHAVADALEAMAPTTEMFVKRAGLDDAEAIAAETDPWTAVALLYHEHVDEPRVLDALRDAPLFFLGALGSRATHKERCETLRAIGWNDAALARIQGPIGEPISAASPPEIAVSILAAVIRAWRETREPR